MAYPFDDPAGMTLYPHEIQRALAIKEAVEADPELTNLTDFEYAQYSVALKAQNFPIPEIIKRIYVMQCFREEYRIEDNVEEGIRFFQAFTSQQHQPGFFLSITYLSSAGNYAAIKDFAAFLPNKTLESPENWRTMLGAVYYRMTCMCTDFRSIREGITLIFECEGAGFANVNPSADEQANATLFGVYPQHHKEMLFVNTPTWLNMAYALWKRSVHPEIHKSIQMGVQLPGYEGHRLDSLYKQPDAETARQNMIGKVRTYLETRYRNQHTFSLATAAAQRNQQVGLRALAVVGEVAGAGQSF